MVGTDRQSGGVSAEKGEKRVILGFTCNGLTRRIQRVENAVVAVRQDSNVDTVRMIFRPEEYNNIPLASVSVKFLYVDTDGEIKAYQTGTTPDSGVYVADWELTDDVVDDAGYINFAVKLAVVNGDTVEKQWFSIPDTFRVYDSVDDTNNPPGETAAEQATNAEKIAQLQSQLGTATSDLSSLTSTVALQGAALDMLNGATAQSRTVALDSAAADLTSIGLYYCGRWADYPARAAETGYVMHMPHPTSSSPMRKQFYMPYATDSIYMRGRGPTGTFSEWQKLPLREDMANYKNLGATTAIPSNSDLDSYTTPGSYSAQSNAIAATITHAPIVQAFTLDVENALGLSSSAWRRQILRASATPDDVYQRFTGGNTWSDWEKIPTRAEMDAVNGRFCVTGNVTGETVQEFIANAVPLLNVPSDLKTATFSAVWANHGYVSGFIRKLRAAGGYNGMFKISSGASESASEEYTFYSWDDVTFYANKMPTRAEVDALNSKHIAAELRTSGQTYTLNINSGELYLLQIGRTGYTGSLYAITGYITGSYTTITPIVENQQVASVSVEENNIVITANVSVVKIGAIKMF